MADNTHLPQIPVVPLRERDEVIAHRLLCGWRVRVSLDSRSHVCLFQFPRVIQDPGTLHALQRHGFFQESVDQRVFDDEVLACSVPNGMDEGVETARVA
jgi:hypothetical protein